MAKVKIPKRVGGVKIPKKVRRKANKALKVAESPVVREFAAAALGAVAQKKADEATARPQANGQRGSTSLAVRIDGDRLAETIRTAAMDGLRRFLEGFEEGLRKAADASGDEADGRDETEAARETDGNGKAKQRPARAGSKPSDPSAAAE